MNKESKIFITEHWKMIGNSVLKLLNEKGYKNIIVKDEHELDLTDEKSVKDFMEAERPEYVILSAGKSGGINANEKYSADFIYNNLKIQNNIINSSFQVGVKKLLFVGSSCCYPKDSHQPIKEEYFMSGKMEVTSGAYSMAKATGIVMCNAYNNQYCTKFIPIIPTNLYGPGDSFDLENSHVLSAVLRKIHEAKKKKQKSVCLWGTGTPQREFLYIDDFAKACIFLLENCQDYGLINVGGEMEISIKELAIKIKRIVGYEGEVVFDSAKPDGTYRKLLDSSKIRNMGWRPEVQFEDGLKLTYEWFNKINEGDV